MSAGVILVTGGSRGIGEAIAVQAAAEGYAVLLTYAGNQAAADKVLARIRSAGGTAEAVQADTAREADILRMFEAADRLGPLKALVYNGGITGPVSTLAEVSADDLQYVSDVNFVGAMISAREAIRRMSTERGGQGGAIVMLSSRATIYGSPGEYVWYAASKGAIDALVIGLAREVGPEGIRVNAVSPGPIDTDIHPPGRKERTAPILPMRRFGTPEEVSEAVMFLVSDKASYIAGANLDVGGAR
jgi:NAD(P)-dependent dehydrogenase (short-subunit alcohol dehydrogenase family)